MSPTIEQLNISRLVIPCLISMTKKIEARIHYIPSKKEAIKMTETFSATDGLRNNAKAQAASDHANQAAEAEAPEQEGTAGATLAELFEQVSKKGATTELALISDNPDSSADVLIVRGTFGEPEAYWFKVNGGIMQPKFANMVLSANKMTKADLDSDEGLYKLIANACGVAACFQSDIPGVKLVEAFISPFEYSLPRFVAGRSVSQIETVYIKRASNVSYKYRKQVQAQQKALEDAMHEEMAQASEYEQVDDAEIDEFFANLDRD